MVMFGGAALYLLGHFLFKRAIWRVISVQRLIAVALLLALPRVRGVLGHVADPFGLAHHRVGEAVDLAVVVQEHEAAQDAGPEPVERHEETGASR